MKGAELPVMGAPRKVPREAMDRAVEGVRRGEVSTREAARRLGVSYSGIYYHLRGGKAWAGVARGNFLKG